MRPWFQAQPPASKGLPGLRRFAIIFEQRFLAKIHDVNTVSSSMNASIPYETRLHTCDFSVKE